MAASTFATTISEYATFTWSEDFTGKSYDFSTWPVTFQDNFPYDPLLSGFKSETGSVGPWYVPGHSNYGVGTFQKVTDPEYRNTFISVPDGGVNLRAHRNSSTSSTWFTAHAATVNTSGIGFAQSYGYYEYYGQLPIASGLTSKFSSWVGFWLLTQNGFDNPRTTNRVEIDAIEWYSGDPKAQHGTVHLIDTTGARKTMPNYHGFGYNLSTAPHSFGVKVTPTWVITYMDRKEIARIPSVEEYSYPMYVLLTNAMMAPTGDFPDLGETEYNYIIKQVSVYGLPMETILDNTDTRGVTVTGMWTGSTNNAGYYGSNYIKDDATGKGQKSVHYTPNLPCDGTYEVYARWIATSGSSTNVPYTIDTGSETQTILVNQTTQGAQWVYMGSYYFNEGMEGSLTVENAGTAAGTYVIADAAKFVLLDPWNRISDNSDTKGVTITGTWGTSSSTPGFYGSNCLYDLGNGKGTKSVQFAPNLPSSGRYEVFMRWTAGTNRATNVPVNVVSANGTTPLQVNQQVSGGQWVSLGTYDFASGTVGNVLISNTGTANGAYVIADAVKFVKRSGVPDIIQDNADSTGVTFTGTWTPSTNSAGYYGANYIKDDATGKGQKSVRFTPTIPYTGVYEVYARWISGSGFAPNVPVDIIGASGTTQLLIDETTNGGKWISLGCYSFNAGTSGSVLFSNAGTANGKYVTVDAVKFVPRK